MFTTGGQLKENTFMPLSAMPLVHLGISHVNAPINAPRKYKRLALKTTLFVRKPFNHISCRKEVETLNVSVEGLLIAASFPLEVATEIEITNQVRNIRAIATVKHIYLDIINTGKYLIGLAIISQPSRWLVIEEKS